MNAAWITLGIIAGIAIALVLNKILADRIENKNHRVALKAAAYIVCAILGAGFALTCSLRTLIDNFVDNRIEFIEIKLSETFPNSNILEIGINTGELSSVIPGLLQLIEEDEDTNDRGIFERLVLNVFLGKLTVYANAAEDGIARILMLADKNGQVTIKSILYVLKEMALEVISPYFVYGQTGIVFLLLIFAGIYIGIVIFLKKGGALYNKSIVFGDTTQTSPPPKNRPGD
jgi:hypothetical protein